jgi:hypothetical protein
MEENGKLNNCFNALKEMLSKLSIDVHVCNCSYLEGKTMED